MGRAGDDDRAERQIEARFTGDVVVAPRLPAFASRMSLKNVRLRGMTFDVHVEGDGFEVRSAAGNCRGKRGQSIVLRDGVPVTQ